ncbi:peptidoglycan DD-metalloendopeptidase family protein [Porticoccaceae bacterium]|jgi:septal ring factor EnvC (AmiA/AmiB activator)|nr:peptidoglycan DD-metalloendopeptidase family protein [Porticoccaceae bacterium]
MKLSSAVISTALSCVLLLLPVDSIAAKDEKAKLADLKSAISSLEKQLDRRDKEKNQLVATLKKVEVEAADASKKIRQLTTQINRSTKTMADLDTQQQGLKAEIKKQNSAVSEQLAAAYKMGEQESIKLLLNQEDPQQLARLLKYYNYVLDARNEKIAQYLTDVGKLSTVQGEMIKQKRSLASAKAQLEKDQQQLLATSKRRQTALKQLNASLQNDKSKLNKLLKERGELEELLKNVRGVVKKMALATPPGGQSFASQKGMLRWPLKGKVAHSFGSQRSGSLRWDGWLIGASIGEPVAAVHDGQVIFSNYMRGFGLLIILNHGDGYMTLYAHNEELLKDTGDWVLSNETIARAGDTGGLDNPALYFEIRKKGQPADPKKWLGKR